jgi:hypothetical protein
MQSYLKTRSAWSQFFIFLSLVFSGLLIFVAMLGTFLATKITGLGLFEVSDMANWNTADPRYALFLRVMLVVQFIGLFLAPVLVFAYLSDPHPGRYLGMRRTTLPFFIAGILVLVVALPLVEYLGALNQKIRFPAAVEGLDESIGKRSAATDWAAAATAFCFKPGIEHRYDCRLCRDWRRAVFSRCAATPVYMGF